jgi:hypothetical protein
MVAVDPATVLKVINGISDHAVTVIKYLNDVKNASNDQKALLDEILAIPPILTRLQHHAGDDRWKATMQALSQENGPFDQLNSELQKMEKKLKAPTGKFAKIGNAGKSLVWSFNKDDVKKHLDRIERIKSILVLSLENNHAYAVCFRCTNESLVTSEIAKRMEMMEKNVKGEIHTSVTK